HRRHQCAEQRILQGGVFGFEKALYLALYAGIGIAARFHERGPLILRKLQRLAQYLLDSCPALRLHCRSFDEISSLSQALAVAHSLSPALGAIFRASAFSSPVRPPKYRTSPTRACCGSTSPSFSSASSTASTSADGSALPPASAISKSSG